MTAHHQDIHRLLDWAIASVQGWAVTADPASASQPIDALAGYAAARFNGDQPWLILGLIRERMAPAERQAMLQQMPPPARQRWTDAGASAFAGFVVELRRPLAPRAAR